MSTASVGTATDSDRYLAQVRAALSDLPGEELEEIIEDLGQHFSELAAESDQPLHSRLGPPVHYADELRTSAGLPPKPATVSSGRTFRDRVVDAFVETRMARTLARFRGTETAAFLRTLRPAWWVLRGYLAVVLLAALLSGLGIHESTGADVFPAIGGDAFGLLLMAVAVVLSVRIGSLTGRGQGRRAGAMLVTALLAVQGLAVIHDLWEFRQQQNQIYSLAPTSNAGYATVGVWNNGEPVRNLYVFDADGRQLQDVQIFDDGGSALQVAAEYEDPSRRLFFTAQGEPVFNTFPIRYRDENGEVTDMMARPDFPVPSLIVPQGSSASTDTSVPSASEGPSAPASSAPAGTSASPAPSTSTRPSSPAGPSSGPTADPGGAAEASPAPR